MTPLLYKHLRDANAQVPREILRSLALLFRHHQNSAIVRLRVIEDILSILQNAAIPVILIKGIALCKTLYPDPALRPMRDIDILVAEDDAEKAQQLLLESGFTLSGSEVPDGHYHLPPIECKADDITICIEIHRGLYPDFTPHYPGVDFAKLLETSRTIRIGKTTAQIFNHEEMLHYLYQHGLRAPITYEPYKLITIADLIAYVEKYGSEINWHHLEKRYPKVLIAISMLSHVTPWDQEKIPQQVVKTSPAKRKLSPTPFTGWPQQPLSTLRRSTSLWKICQNTFLPSRWWVNIYYGKSSVLGYLKALVTEHYKQLYQIAKLYKAL